MGRSRHHGVPLQLANHEAKEGDAVAFWYGRRIIRARIADWNGKPDYHAVMLDASGACYIWYAYLTARAGQSFGGFVPLPLETVPELLHRTAELMARPSIQRDIADCRRPSVEVQYADGSIERVDTSWEGMAEPGGGFYYTWMVPDQLVDLARPTPGGPEWSDQFMARIEKIDELDDALETARNRLAAHSQLQALVYQMCVEPTDSGRPQLSCEELARRRGVDGSVIREAKGRAIAFMRRELAEWRAALEREKSGSGIAS